MVVVGHEGAIVEDATLGAYNTNEFLEFIHTKAIHIFDRQMFVIVDNVPFRISRLM